jgi:diguanylate cyclase (GGDEF)-like protein
LKGAEVGGFRLKLAAYFVLLSLLPLAAAWWAFGSVATRGVRNTSDARLEAGLRAGIAAYADELDEAQQEAESLARRNDFQAALSAADRKRLERLLAGTDFYVVGPGKLRAGREAALAATRRVSIVSDAGDAMLVAYVPFDRRFLIRLRVRSGLEERDELLLLRDGRVLVGPSGFRGPARLTPGDAEQVHVAGREYRGMAVVVDVADRVALAALTPQSAIAASQRSLQWRLLLGLLAALLVIAAIAYLAGRSIVESLDRLVHAADAISVGRLDERVPVRGRDEFAQLGRSFNRMADQLQQRLRDLEDERRRLRGATGRFAEALGATHDIKRLLRVIVEDAVDATHANGGYLLAESGEMVHVGDPHAGPAAIKFPLETGSSQFGTLVLLGSSFSEEAVGAARALANEAAVALDNAHLHQVVEQQALVDGLTGLANRRQLEQQLSSALARAERQHGPVALIMADLDDFKQINDEHGHAAGDDVLRQFAQVLQEAVREMDVPGRWGGEEFAVVLPDADAEGAAVVAERVRSALERRTLLTPEGEAIAVTASLGVAAYPESSSGEMLLEAADDALYRAKHAGKNLVATAVDVLDHD